MNADSSLKITTKDVAPTRFAAHGIVEIFFENDILFYECFGPFNKELVDAMAVAQMEFLQTTDRDAGPWGSICLMRGSAIASPDAMVRYSEMMHASKPPQFTPVATAFSVAPEVEGGSLMMPLYADIYASIARPFKSFDALDDARRWVQSMIDAEKTR